MNWSLLIAACALLISVLSPLITTLFSNRHASKMKNIEFSLERRANAIEAYISAVGRIVKRGKLDGLEEYGKYMGEAYLYIDESLWGHLDKISDGLQFGNVSYRATETEFRLLCKALSKENLRPKV